MKNKSNKTYLFVIDTNDYAGNFERELCAYITGRVGDCEVGDDMAELFTKETKLKPFLNVIDLPDEDGNGCFRPCDIYPTPGWFNHGMGSGDFKDGDEEAALIDYIKAVTEYETVYLKQKENILDILRGADENKKIDYIKHGCSEKGALKEIKNHNKEIDKAKKLKKVKKYPADLSVAINFETVPTKKQIDLMKERSFKFAALSDEYGEKRINKVTGFRLIEESTTRQDHSI